MISLDTLRADRLGFAGYERPTSPNIDKLAAESVVFDDAVTQYTATKWSFRSLVMGKYPFRLHADFDESTTFAESLRAAGYVTAAFTGGGYVSKAWGIDRGFDLFDESRSISGLAESVPGASKWLRAHRNDRFLLFLHSYDIHCPYVVPEPHQSRYTGGFSPKRDLTICDPTKIHTDLRDDEFAYVSAIYDGGIGYADELLSPLLSQLDKLDLADRTIVVLTSDHGEALGERRWVGHGRGHVYEETARVPLLIRVPGVAPGVIGEPVQLVDLAPTILSLVGVVGSETSEFDGEDLSPILRRDFSFEGRRPRLTESGWNKSYSRDDRWRLILRGETGSIELYDLLTDPSQVHDVASTNSQITSEMAEELSAMLGQAWGAAPDPSDDDVPRSDRILEAQLKALGYLD